MRVGVLLVLATLLGACSDEPVPSAKVLSDPLVGSYAGAQLTGRGGPCEWEVSLNQDRSAALLEGIRGSRMSWKGTWKRDGDFVVLEVHQVDLDPELVGRAAERMGDPDFTSENLESLAYVLVAVPSTGGLNFYPDDRCVFAEYSGDPHELVQRALGGPVLLKTTP